MAYLIKLLRKSFIGRIYAFLSYYASEYGFAILLIFIRIWMARIFFYSGLTKISNWQSTISLFQYEYKVPIIPTELAAILATTSELILPILLVIGLASRLATVPLLIMTMVIEFTYLSFVEHLYWAILLGVILLYGPGRYSLDHWIRSQVPVK